MTGFIIAIYTSQVRYTMYCTIRSMNSQQGSCKAIVGYTWRYGDRDHIGDMIFFHSHLEFSSTFLYASSIKNSKKIESLQKQAIRLLIGLPRISHTSEAF